jgi:hypothetical protein
MAAVALRLMYSRIGFDNGAEDSIVDVQQINSVAELGYLTDLNVHDLCTTIRKPGGYMPNPAFVAGQVPALPPMVPYLGIMVSTRAEGNMKLASYTVRHNNRISRTTNVATMNPTSLRRLVHLKLKEEEKPDPPTAPKIDHKNWPKTMDAIHDYFTGVLGETKVPLAYVIRDTVEVTPEADDLPRNYASPEDEMVARMPHQDANGVDLPTYLHDRSRVWQTMSEICQDDKSWTYVKPFQRSRDGRGAYRALHTHYLGLNHVNNMANEAESKLARASYDGEKKRYNFESYISTLNEQFSVLNNLRRFGYSGIDEASKVRRLNAGIKTDKLDAPKAQIMSSRDLQENFDAAVGLYQDFIAQSKTHGDNSDFNVSGFEGGGGGEGRGRGGGRFGGRGGGRFGGRFGGRGRGRGGGGRGGFGKRKHHGGGGDVQDRHYSPKEYEQLSSEQKSQLKTLRDARINPETRQAAQLLTQLLAGASIAATETETGNGNNQVSFAEDEGNPNRNHGALKKPKRG